MITEQIKREIADGSLYAITLDTNVFDKNALKLNAGLLKQIEQFKGTSVSFVLSEIVYREVLSHLKNNLSESQSSLTASLNDVRKWWGIAGGYIDKVKSEIFECSPESVAQSRLSDFRRRTDCQIILLDNQPILSEITRRYFSGKPPFGDKSSKKHEFPDALALLSLDAWAETNATKIIAVSSDNDWKKYGAESGRLIVIDDLSEALSFFQEDSDILCEILSLRIANKEFDSAYRIIIDALRDQIYINDFVVEASASYSFESDIDEVAVMKFKFDIENAFENRYYLKPVHGSMETLVAEASLIVSMSVYCFFSFYTSGNWGKGGKEPMGFASLTTKIDFPMDVLITFIRSGEDYNITAVEVISQTVNVDFGKVAPDWDEPEEPDFEPDWDETPSDQGILTF
ncbi:MAG: DUF4935 domain-containing protein [Alphaproteobacteria bacterium]|nr:DUF4935 domain-containing protein [Alphaproteobacteria bacterium]